MDARQGARPQPYTHPARELVNRAAGERRECSVCGYPVTGAGDTLRHYGEAIRPTAPLPADAATFHADVRLVRAALADLPAPSRWISDADRARAAVQALYEAGALRSARQRARADRPRIAA